MPGQTAVLSVKVLVDTAKAKSGMADAEKSVGKFQSGLRKAAAPAGIALAAVVAFGKGAADSASRTEQAMGGLDSVFKDNSATVKTWAENAASSVGLAKSEYGELATVIGSQL